MRVTHIITRLIVGGAQENTIASVLGLAGKHGFDVDLISGPSRGPEGSLESSFAHAPQLLRIEPHLVRPVHPWKDWIALRRLTTTLRQLRPDIVHTHSGKAGVLGRLAAARANVSLVVHTVHGPSFGPFQTWLPNTVFKAAERYAAKVTDHFVVVADAMTRQYLAAGIGQPEQYTKVLSGFNLAPFLASENNPSLRQRWNLGANDVVVGKVARICHLKGHDDLLAIAPELIRRCPHVKFLLVGDGEWRPRLEAKACELGLKRQIVFTGLVSPNDIPQLLGIMDVLVHLSLREGLPRALPQALAAGKPVVAYDCDGAREVCLDNETGFLLQRGDRSNLMNRLVQLANDPSLRQQLGQRGREFVREQFAVERLVDGLHHLYLKLARARGLAVP